MVDQYQICTRCVMDTSAKDIVFDEQGVCNFCTNFIIQSGHVIHESSDSKRIKLDLLVNEIKRKGKGKKYDCIVGVSGGVDSSWVLVQAVKLGLRPLAVHMDNGWNSELAQNNIAKLVNGLGVDLHTHVINWLEYKSLMQAFFDANVIDIELLYDNAMLAVNYQMANHHGIKFILSGSNQATEGMLMPQGWNWFKYDKKNIGKIAQKFGGVKIKTFPAIGTLDYVWFRFIKKIKWTSILDLMDYNKFQAMSELQQNHGYKPYPYKHYESIFTRFYQGYILPGKFLVDKRRLHLSTLIISGQLTREKALEGLKGIPYASESDRDDDIKYFIKKMGWGSQKLDAYLSEKEIQHSAYGSELWLWNFFTRIRKLSGSILR